MEPSLLSQRIISYLHLLSRILSAQTGMISKLREKVHPSFFLTLRRETSMGKCVDWTKVGHQGVELYLANHHSRIVRTRMYTVRGLFSPLRHSSINPPKFVGWVIAQGASRGSNEVLSRVEWWIHYIHSFIH
jgi:hypothetical protein